MSMAKNGYSDVIPTTYDEVDQHYSQFIITLLGKHNKVERTTRELYQHIWEKLLQSKLLERYWEKVDGSLPRTMLRDDACEFLSVTLTQWNNAMAQHHTKGRGHWMPTPINLPEFEAQGKKGLYSKKALYDTDDILKLAEEEADADGNAVSVFTGRGPLQWPASKVTPAHFRNYLAMAVRRHFINYCRTKSRRHKERLGDTFREFRAFDDGTHREWDQNLLTTNSLPAVWSKKEQKEHKRKAQAGEPSNFITVRGNATVVLVSSAETLVALSEATGKLSASLRTSMAGVESCKPVEEHEAEMFELLGQGIRLASVVKRLDIPTFARRAVLRSVEQPTR